ncbi:hypothetical protein BH24ACI5_BH24ACI5_24690 [soil metagenome]
MQADDRVAVRSAVTSAGPCGRLRILPVVALVIASVSSLSSAQERPLRRIPVPALITAVAFSPDGETLLAWDPAGWSRWDIASGRQRGREIVFAKACERVLALPRSQDGRVIAAQCRNQLLFFEVATARSLGEGQMPDKQTAAMYTASANGSLAALVMAGATDTVVVGAMADGVAGTALRIGSEVEQLTLSASGTRLTVGTSQGVQVRELPGGTLLRTIEGSAAHALSADGRQVAVLSDRGARLFDADTGHLTRDVEGRVSHLRFSDDGTRLVGWTNQRLILWDVATGAQRLALESDEFVAAAVSPDGQRLVTVSLERRGDRVSSIIGVWRVPST